jgi:hypothetical protein
MSQARSKRASLFALHKLTLSPNKNATKPNKTGSASTQKQEQHLMGLFRSSGGSSAAKKAETQQILLNKKVKKKKNNGSSSIDLKASSSWDEDNDVDNAAVEQGSTKPKFWRLHEELVVVGGGESHHNKADSHLEPNPPLSSSSSSSTTAAAPAKEASPARIKKMPRKKQMFQKLDSVDELLVSSTTPSKSKDQIKKTSSKQRSSSSSKKIKRANVPLHALPSMDEQSETSESQQRFAVTSTSGSNPQQQRYHQQRIKTSTSVDSATTVSIAEYQPPPAFLTSTHPIGAPNESGAVAQLHPRMSGAATKSAATILTLPQQQSGADKRSTRQFQSFMHDCIAATFSDDTMDHGGEGPPLTIPATNSDTTSGLYSESGFPTSHGGHKFRQIVFDQQFQQIENVKVAKSGTSPKYTLLSHVLMLIVCPYPTEPGASDFSDFVQAAAKLTKKLAPTAAAKISGKSAKKKIVESPSPTPIKTKPAVRAASPAPRVTAWPKLDETRKRRDTPGYSANNRGTIARNGSTDGSGLRARSGSIDAASRLRARGQFRSQSPAASSRRAASTMSSAMKDMENKLSSTTTSPFPTNGLPSVGTHESLFPSNASMLQASQLAAGIVANSGDIRGRSPSPFKTKAQAAQQPAGKSSNGNIRRSENQFIKAMTPPMNRLLSPPKTRDLASSNDALCDTASLQQRSSFSVGEDGRKKPFRQDSSRSFAAGEDGRMSPFRKESLSRSFALEDARKSPFRQERARSPFQDGALSSAGSQALFPSTSTMLQASQLAAGIGQHSSQARAQPIYSRIQSPTKPREASASASVHGIEPFFDVKDGGRKSPFRQESSRSFSHHAEALFAPPPQPVSHLAASKDDPADNPRPKLPTVSTSREDWMDRNQSPLSFGQSEVSFTPENVLAREDFAFERDFDGFDTIRTKLTIDGFQSPKSERVMKARAESFDWDTDFHRAASPFKSRPTPEPPSFTHASLSLDEGLVSTTRTASSRTTPRDSDYPVPKSRDPSPLASQQRSIPKIARSGSTTQSQSGPQKTPPKAVPTNAILGSMLFRQTQTSNTPDNKGLRQSETANTPDSKSQPDGNNISNNNNAASSCIGDNRSKDATPSSSSFICENRSRDTGSTSMFSRQQQSSHIEGNRSKDFESSTPSRGAALSQKHGGRGGFLTRTATATTTTLDKVPSAVAASDGSESNVSSVTEEASSFYKKSFGGGRSSPRWSEPAQKLVNNYNVRSKNQLRTASNNNSALSGGSSSRDHHFNHHHQGATPSRFRQGTDSNRSIGEPGLSRSEAEHINVFLSEV